MIDRQESAPRSDRPVLFGKALSLSALLVLVALLKVLPPSVRLILLGGLAAGWFWFGCRTSIRRYGRKAIVAIAGIVASIGGLVASAVWIDLPDRRFVAQIEQIPGCSAATEGRVFTGKVDHVYISSRATDQDVSRFTELAGLDHLRNLIIDGPELTDATARRIGRLTSLWNLFLRGTGVSQAAIADLRRDLPNCRIEAE